MALPGFLQSQEWSWDAGDHRQGLHHVAARQATVRSGRTGRRNSSGADRIGLPWSRHVPEKLEASSVKQGHPRLWLGRPQRNPLMWQETVMYFLNPQHWDSCDGVNAAFHFLGKKGCLAARLRS